MKKLVLLIQSICALFLLVLVLACQSQKGENKPEELLESKEKTELVLEKPIPQLEPIDISGGILLQSVSHSYLNETNVGETLTITGLLQGSDNTWVLIENPESRGRVSFHLVVQENLLQECIDLKDSVVTLTGILLEASQVWTKKIEVLVFE